MNHSRPEIDEKLKQLPPEPGVYLFRNKQGKIIYVGKAKLLKNRVRSYFRQNHADPKITALVNSVAELEWIVTGSEVEALLLENNLIKEHYPRYNVMLKDDKTFPYIEVTGELFPKIRVTRTVYKGENRYLGPYTNTRQLRKTLHVIHKIFPLRNCRYTFDEAMIAKKKVSLCLEYHLKNCQGPCQGLVHADEYQAMINKIVRFLNGQTRDIVQELTQQMKAAAESRQYEEAARIRDQLAILTEYSNSQNIVQTDFKNRDILTVAATEKDAVVVIFRIREGNVIGREHFYLKQIHGQTRSEIAKDFIRDYYSQTPFIPRELFVDVNDETDLYASYLEKLSGHPVHILQPERGSKAKLWTLAQKNADMLLRELMTQKLKVENKPGKMVESLQQALNLAVPPMRIEGFDISNIQGSHTVASMVSFENGKADKKEYRKFIIKTVEGPDDYASMQETIQRRYSRVLEENLHLPDLILIDGGKGQLNAAKAILDELGLHHIPIIGLAKRLEEVFVPGYSYPQNIPKSAPGLTLLRRIRDEAHRFAITFHRQRRDKDMVNSFLDTIPGIGPAKRKKLLEQFGSVQVIRQTDEKEIANKTGFSVTLARKVAEAVRDEFRETTEE